MERVRNLFREAGQFVAAVLRPALKSVRDNSGLAVLSIVLAFGLWIVVSDAENPTRTRRLPVDIAVQAVDLPADLAIADDLAPVRVRIRVEDDAFDSLLAADFQATVDLEGLAVGKYKLPVDVRALTSRGGLRVEDILPEKIDVELVQLTGKSVPVTVEVRGDPPADFTMGSPQAEDATADVSGPQAKVSMVTRVVASLDADGRTENIDQAVRLEPRDERGLLVQGVSVDPSFTQVSIDIEQKVYRKALVVSPQVTGAPGPGYNVTGVSVTPTTVTVSGSKSFIAGATDIRTQPVNISGAEEDIIRSVSLDVPSGIEVLGGVNVTITVNIEAATGQVVLAVPIVAAGLASGLSVSGALPSALVVLYGPLPEILGLSPNDLAAVVDLKDKDAGAHTVKVKVTAPAGAEVRSVTPEEIEVILEKRAP